MYGGGLRCELVYAWNNYIERDIYIFIFIFFVGLLVELSQIYIYIYNSIIVWACTAFNYQ